MRMLSSLLGLVVAAVVGCSSAPDSGSYVKDEQSDQPQPLKDAKVMFRVLDGSAPEFSVWSLEADGGTYLLSFAKYLASDQGFGQGVSWGRMDDELTCKVLFGGYRCEGTHDGAKTASSVVISHSEFGYQLVWTVTQLDNDGNVLKKDDGSDDVKVETAKVEIVKVPEEFVVTVQ